MSRLSEYTELSEKEAVFENGEVKIDTKEDFDKYFEKLVNYDRVGTYIFRGSGEARYKLFTSAQRYWIEHQLDKQGKHYHAFVKKLIKNCKDWNNKTIFTFFNRNGIDTNNALAYLSYMQHYRVPTPLLDFTDSPYIGLFFALEQGYSSSSDKEIDNYCSLYVVDTSSQYFYSTIQQFERDIGEQDVDEIDYDQHLASFPVLLVTTENISYKIINNINISNQEGVFFYNNNPVMPIEEVYKQELGLIKESMGESAFQRHGYNEKFALCLNIHKNLRDYVLLKLLDHDVTPDFIYPNNKQLSAFSLKKTLEDL